MLLQLEGKALVMEKLLESVRQERGAEGEAKKAAVSLYAQVRSGGAA